MLTMTWKVWVIQTNSPSFTSGMEHRTCLSLRLISNRIKFLTATPWSCAWVFPGPPWRSVTSTIATWIFVTCPSATRLCLADLSGKKTIQHMVLTLTSGNKINKKVTSNALVASILIAVNYASVTWLWHKCACSSKCDMIQNWTSIVGSTLVVASKVDHQLIMKSWNPESSRTSRMCNLKSDWTTENGIKYPNQMNSLMILTIKTASQRRQKKRKRPACKKRAM